MASLTLDAILDAALRIAAGRHWESVRLVDVADELGVPLAALHPHLSDKEALVDALWDRADAALLRAASDRDLRERDVPARLESLVFAWLDTLAEHRRTVREMLLVRLEPGHLHIQVPSLVRLSRTVQWLREAAGLRAGLAWRALEESALTALFTATVVTWLRGNDTAARERLRRGLDVAHELRRRIGPRE